MTCKVGPEGCCHDSSECVLDELCCNHACGCAGACYAEDDERE